MPSSNRVSGPPQISYRCVPQKFNAELSVLLPYQRRAMGHINDFGNALAEAMAQLRREYRLHDAFGTRSDIDISAPITRGSEKFCAVLRRVTNTSVISRRASRSTHGQLNEPATNIR